MGKKASYKGKKQYPVYKSENRFAKNKKAKLQRHLAKHPNDKSARSCLDKGDFEHSRKSPMIRKWSNAEMRHFVVRNNRNVRALRNANMIDDEQKSRMLIPDPMVFAARQAAAKNESQKSG